MSELKHTPGPWEIKDGWDANGNGTYFPSVVICGKRENSWGEIVVNVSHDQKRQSIMANAKLIAAAPDLLQALIKGRDHLQNYLDYDEHNAGYNETEMNEREKIICTIIDAIKKATE